MCLFFSCQLSGCKNSLLCTSTIVDMTHITALERLCRVCGKSTITKSMKTKHLCSEYDESLISVFGIDITHDSHTAHPQQFCHACKLVLHKAQSEGYKHRTVVFEEWSEHSDTSCSVCQHFESIQKGGRPKKVQHTTGRPCNDSPRYCIQAIQDIAPPAMMPSIHTNATICEEHQAVDLRELECPICCDTLQRPVELVDCCTVVSADCCCTWLEYSTSTNCPCCHGDHLCNFSSVRQASPLLLSVLASLCVVCVKCGDHMRKDTYSEHVECSCQSCSISSSQDSPDTSIDKIMNRPLSTPLTAVEQKLQSRLAKRSLAASPEENVLKIKTGGQVNYTIVYMQ